MIGFLLLTATAYSPVPCGITNAERVTLEALLADPAPRERCVAVRGLWSGHVMFRDRREARLGGTNVPRLGVHTIEAIRARSIRPDYYTAVGNVFRCDDIAVDADALGGFCRDNPSGLYIAAGDMRRDRWPTLRSDY